MEPAGSKQLHERNGMILTAVLLMAISPGDTPMYTLEPAGIDFHYLPEYLTPLAEGAMGEESGALAGQPNSMGITFGCHYWKIDEPVEDKDFWIEQKLSSVISPDLMEHIIKGEPTWCEGSMAAGVPSSHSLGLMSRIDFTFSPPGGAMGRGRAYGIFRNGYSVLLIAYGPASMNAQDILESIVNLAVLSE